jgi:hypothetical protein
MKILKPFTNWWNKTGVENKTPTKIEYFDYKKAIREREDQEREYLKKWKKEFKQRMNNSNNTYSTSIGHLPGSVAQKYANITVNDNTPTILKVDGTIEVQGRDILKELDEMRDALLLLKRDVDMESKYPRLRELKDEYEQALEKYKTFEALK